MALALSSAALAAPPEATKPAQTPRRAKHVTAGETRPSRAGKGVLHENDPVIPAWFARTEPGANKGKVEEKKVEPKPAAGKRGDEKKAEAKAEAKADSVGPPNEGRLMGGIHLDTTKPYVRVVPAYAGADTRWGLPALIHAIDRSAKAVNKTYPGAVLPVGDISRKGGGDLMHHHSHESGRDADLGFYVVDEHGKQIEGHSFVKFDAKLAAKDSPGAHFDLARNWLLLQNLLLNREARVSHIFVADPIKHALLAHARSYGASRALLSRAAQVMMEPTGAPPHDDHFHVRISCPASMKKTCVEYAKNAPSKARVKMARKGRAGMKTPAHRAQAAEPKKKTPARTNPERKVTANAAASPAPSGIYLSKAAKAADGKDVPVSLWALAGAALGHPNQHASATNEREEADADAAEVKDALDESGAPKITE
jgi:penicillin-insensitive murein endopeptidase